VLGINFWVLFVQEYFLHLVDLCVPGARPWFVPIRLPAAVYVRNVVNVLENFWGLLDLLSVPFLWRALGNQTGKKY